MANKQINELTEITSIEETDLLVVYDVDEGGSEKTKKILKSNFLGYEESSSILTVSDSQSGGNETSTATAYYTKVGNSITISCVFNNINTTGLTSGATLYITGLPYTSSNNVRFLGSVRTSDITFNGQIVVETVENTDVVRFINAKGDGSTATILVNQLTDDSTDIRFTLTYFTS